MRQGREFFISTLRSRFLLVLSSSLFIAACSLPEVNFDKQKRLAQNSPVSSFTHGGNPKGADKRYLTTVHIRFSESKDATPLSFDIRRDKRAMIAAKLFETEKTSTVMSLGYSRGPVVGCRFSWRF